jgi:ABC-2 type transport system permease protein
MTDAIALYGRLLALNLRAQLQYPASFALATLSQGLVTGVEFLGIWVLFARFGQLRDWSLDEVALFYGVVNLSFAIADGLARGFDQMAELLRLGEFDRLLLRPRGTVLQVAASRFDFKKIGRIAQSLVVLAWAMPRLELSWAPSSVLLLIGTVAGGVALFYALFMLQAALCFWTTETLELANIATYGGTQTAQFPLSIYRAELRALFTYLIPLGCVAYYPLVAILQREDPLGSARWFQYASPLLGGAFLGLACLIWRAGIRRHASTGS